MEQQTFCSISEALDQIELYLSTNLHLSIPEIYPRDLPTRFQTVIRLLQGLNPTIIIEQLPTLLVLSEDPSCCSLILDLLLQVLSENSEEIFQMLIQGTKNPKTKKPCLGLFKELVEKGNVKSLHRVIHSLAAIINDEDRETAQFARDVGRKIRDAIFRTQPPNRPNESNGLVFGVIPPQLFEEFVNSSDKKTKLVALKSIEEILCNLADLLMLRPYESEIIQLINDVLMDPNRSFVGSGLRIGIKLCQADFNFAKLSTVLRSKLADPTIPYRKSAFKILLHTINKSQTLPAELLPDLINENWHVREETVNLFIGGALRGLKYENIDLIPSLAKLLDDDKSKIRQVTEEAFAVLAKLQGDQVILSKLQPIVDELELNRLKSRFEIDSIAKIENGAIVFPRILPTSAPLVCISSTISPTTSSHFLSTFTGLSFSPTPTITQEFKFIENISTVTPVQRSSSLSRDRPEVSSLFPTPQVKLSQGFEGQSTLRQSSEFVKPPLPRTMSKRTLPSLSSEEFKKSMIDKTYTEFVELEMLKEPLQEFAKAAAVTEDNWEKQFEAVDVYRRLIKFHKEVLGVQNSHKIVGDLVRWGDSLRSALCKNALMAIGEFCSKYPKVLDPDIESMLNLLLRKSTDTNVFIAEVSIEALVLCVSNCNLSRVIPCILLNISSAKSGNLKSKLALCCKCVLQRTGKSFPTGIDRIVISMAGYIQEAAPEVRESARDCFSVLGKELDKVLGKYLPESVMKSVKDILEKDAKRRSISKTEARHRSISTRSTSKRSSICRSTSNRLRISQNFKEEANLIQDINADLNSEDWKVRLKTLEKITGCIIEESKSGQNSNKLISLFDCFCRTVNDQNSKIVQQSLASLKDLIPKIGSCLEPNMGLLINSLVVTLGSNSQPIRDISQEICDKIVNNCDHLFVIGPFTSAINVANPKARSILIETIGKTMQSVYQRKPQLLNKFAVPLLCKVIEDPNPSVREQAEKFALKLYELIGEQIFTQVPSIKQAKIREVIKSESG